MLIVGRASCQCHAYCRAGRMPTLLILIRQWNWHLASVMLIVGRAGCQCHAYCRAGRMPTLLLLISQ
ncbi:MAG: hypothetical protein F6K56_25310 [Moorea sp. SIO3G5]|nr:hypothetical protein [Moorena sp. SIO3G5]